MATNTELYLYLSSHNIPNQGESLDISDCSENFGLWILYSLWFYYTVKDNISCAILGPPKANSETICFQEVNLEADRRKHCVRVQSWELILLTQWELRKMEHLLSVQFSGSVISDSLQPHGLQYTRLPCPSQTAGACSNSCPSSQWCNPTILPSVIPFSSCLRSFPANWRKLENLVYQLLSLVRCVLKYSLSKISG